jgi:hypothetical protein
MVPSSLTADSVSTVSKTAFLSEKSEHVLWHPDTMQVAGIAGKVLACCVTEA